MNNIEINISDIRCGMLFRVKEDCTVKGFNLEKDTNLYVKRIYSRGDKVSFVVPAHLLKDRSKKTLAVGAKYINLYFENKEVYKGTNLLDMVKLNEDVEIDNNKKNGEVKVNNKNIEKPKNRDIFSCYPDVKRAFVNGTTTIVILHTGEKGIAKCHKDDVYVEDFGYIIARNRAKIKVEEKAIRRVDSHLRKVTERCNRTKDQHRSEIEKLKKGLKNMDELIDTYTDMNIENEKENMASCE